MRASSLLVIVAFAAAAGLLIKKLTEAGPHAVRVVDAEGGADLSRLALATDPVVTPLRGHGLTPGNRVRYSLRITNRTPDAIRHVVARSVRVVRSRADEEWSVLSVSDPSCWGVGRVECIFQELEPGETRTVRVVAKTSPRHRPGDGLLIHTFIGRFTGPVAGSVPLEVVGAVRETSGRFG